jgi:hypothetical protein
MATAPLTFTTGQTAILMADFHHEGMGDNPDPGFVQRIGAAETPVASRQTIVPSRS